jgi:RNA polymerase sigma-32 factor
LTAVAKKTPKKSPPAALEKKKLVSKGVIKRRPSIGVVPTDPLLQAYLREIQRYPLLSREEEHELALYYHKTQDREALQKLVTSNLRFVVKVAYEYVHYRIKLLDLIQEGNMGLVKAVQEFDPYKDVRLTTYAVWWIRSYIQDSILKNFSLVKIGTTQAQKRLFYRLRQEQRQLEQMGILPQERVKLIAAKLDVKEKEVEEMQQRLAQNDLSLNAPIKGGEDRQHIEMMTHPAAAPDVELGETEQRELFRKVLNEFAKSLEGREKVIFHDRLISENPLTLQEIGDKYKITKERARQIEEQIKERLKEYVSEHYPDFNLLTEA